MEGKHYIIAIKNLKRVGDSPPALPALPEDSSLVPSTYKVASSRRSDALFWPPQALHECGALTYKPTSLYLNCTGAASLRPSPLALLPDPRPRLRRRLPLAWLRSASRPMSPGCSRSFPGSPSGCTPRAVRASKRPRWPGHMPSLPRRWRARRGPQDCGWCSSTRRGDPPDGWPSTPRGCPSCSQGGDGNGFCGEPEACSWGSGSGEPRGTARAHQHPYHRPPVFPGHAPAGGSHLAEGWETQSAITNGHIPLADHGWESDRKRQGVPAHCWARASGTGPRPRGARQLWRAGLYLPVPAARR
ncbi:putative hydroxypyruvate isomerase isoform X2 [Arvicanthis niloticus]|uniref:putative hydroxypyruvate isomerase isoform X2 n=1 Tax=Arvicanthis niloticus TaxID=61156 RepID=UPI00402B554F